MKLFKAFSANQCYIKTWTGKFWSMILNMVFGLQMQKKNKMHMNTILCTRLAFFHSYCNTQFLMYQKHKQCNSQCILASHTSLTPAMLSGGPSSIKVEPSQHLEGNYFQLLVCMIIIFFFRSVPKHMTTDGGWNVDWLVNQKLRPTAKLPLYHDDPTWCLQCQKPVDIYNQNNIWHVTSLN